MSKVTIRPHSIVKLSVEDPDGSARTFTCKTSYPDAAVQDVFASFYRAMGLTEFAWFGEPFQDDIDYLKEKYELS